MNRDEAQKILDDAQKAFDEVLNRLYDAEFCVYANGAKVGRTIAPEGFKVIYRIDPNYPI